MIEENDAGPVGEAFNILSVDVEYGYRLTLGRAPESPEVVEVKRAHTPLSLFRDFLESDEFNSSVYIPIASGGYPRDDLFKGRPSFDLGIWIGDFVPLETGTRDALDGPLSWARALALVLADHHFQSWVNTGADTWQEAGFIEQLRRWASGRHRRVIGHFDLADASGVRGWAVNTDRPSERLTLLFFADGLLVGSCETSMMREDVGAEYGGNGEHGFALEIDLSRNRPSQHAARLSMREAESYLVLAEADIPLPLELNAEALAEVRSELTRVARILADVEQRLAAFEKPAAAPMS